jgi:hypothetical protein
MKAGDKIYAVHVNYDDNPEIASVEVVRVTKKLLYFSKGHYAFGWVTQLPRDTGYYFQTPADALTAKIEDSLDRIRDLTDEIASKNRLISWCYYERTKINDDTK